MRFGQCAGLNVAENNLTAAKAYPNPFSNQIILSFSQIEELEIIEVFDLTGKLIHQFKPNESSNMYSLELHSLSPGIYLIKAQNSTGNSILKRVVKQ